MSTVQSESDTDHFASLKQARGLKIPGTPEFNTFNILLKSDWEYQNYYVYNSIFMLFWSFVSFRMATAFKIQEMGDFNSK